MILVLIVYIISALSWGAILLQLSKAIIASIKSNQDRPPLLVPLAVASLAITIENTYFGIASIVVFIGNRDLFMAMFQSQNWFLIGILIAVSGVLLLFNLNAKK